jgi:hypothetical protein
LTFVEDYCLCARALDNDNGAARLWGQHFVKMIAEYLEHALQFERMAAEATDPKLKESFEKQAIAYRKLAEARAGELNLRPVPRPQKDG